MGVLREEFRRNKFNLRHYDARAFYKSQWSRGPTGDLLYVIYRVFAFVYTSGWLTAQIVFNASPQGGGTGNSMFAYLTIWSYILLTCHLLVAAFIAVYHYCCESCCGVQHTFNHAELHQETAHSVSFENKALSVADSGNGYSATKHVADPTSHSTVTSSTVDLSPTHRVTARTEADDLRWFHKLSWILVNMLMVIAPAITLLYFAVLLPMFIKYMPYNNALFLISDLHLHAFNTLAILIDILVGAYPIRLFHFVFPAAYGITYVIFSAIYWSFDPANNVLYPILLDWNHAGLTIAILLVLLLIALPLVQFAFFGLYRLRLYLFGRCFGQVRNAIV